MDASGITNIVLLISGAILGFFSDLLAEALFPSIHSKYRNWLLRRLSRQRKQLLRSTISPQDMTIAGLPIQWIVLERANFIPGRIRCTYDNTPFELEPEFKQMAKDQYQSVEERLARGDTEVPWDSATYKLLEFGVGRREIVNGEEIGILPLKFGPTSYFEQIVTDLNTTNPIRNRFARETNIAEKPVRQFSSILGVNLSLVTKDSYLIVTERSQHTHTAGNSLHTSVAENLLRPTDAGPDGSPDPFRCAVRGAQEELGVPLDYQSIKFIAFGVHPVTCQYSLLGWSELPYTREEVAARRRLGVPKDKWENRELVFVPFNPDSVADFVLSRWKDWFSIGLAAVILTLYQVYSEKEVEDSFSQARSRLRV